MPVKIFNSTTNPKLGGKKGDGWVSTYFNRPISTRISKLSLKLYPRIKPIHFTVVTLSIGLLATMLTLTLNLIAAGILFQLASIIDGCDGEIARYKNMMSKKGDYLDSVVDRIIDSSVLTAFAYSLWKLGERIDFVLLWLGTFLTFSFLISYTSQNSRRLWGVDHHGTIERRDTRVLLVSLIMIMYPFFPKLAILTLISYTTILATFVGYRIFIVAFDKWP